MIKNKYEKLFEPFQIKNVSLKNRIVKSAQWLLLCEPDGSIGKRIKAFYETLAKGGVGLITVEESICDFPLGASNVPHIRLDEDRFIPGLSELAEVIHKHNCPAFVQITHAGPAHNPQVSGKSPLAPSSLDPPVEPLFAVAKELTISEIKDLIEKYAQAALRVKKAGFDGVEIHMAHYALVNAFLSRIQNKRQDEYGGQNLENRARFAIEILRRTRELVGRDWVVGVRMSAKEWGHPLGTTLEEAIEFAKMFEKAGADYIQASAYGYGPFMLCALPDFVLYPEITEETKEFAQRIPKGALIPEAAAIKKNVNIPVSGVGRLNPQIAEEILREGKVDLVCFGRRLMADPELPKKLMEGREEDIRPCLGCSECIHIMLMNQPVQCRMNPFMGNELEMVLRPASKKRKVIVVGAGPAGLEAARVAAERGHKVTLYDRAPELGGLLPMAAFIKGKDLDDLTEAIRYYETQLKKLKVKVHLKTSVDVDLILKEKPEVVILAPGGKPVEPDIPISKNSNVVTTEQLKSKAKEFLKFFGTDLINKLTKIYLPVGQKVVVVGGDLAGVEAAEFLLKRGKKVTIVEEAESIGEGVLVQWLVKLLPWFQSKGVDIFTGVKYEEINSKGLVIKTKEGEKKTIEADTVMIVNRYQKNNELHEKLKGKGFELYLIGDAKRDRPGYILKAIHDGAKVGLMV